VEVDLEVRHLKLISAIAEEGGMTRASHRLHVTQSALSHQLRSIEERLGVALFVRRSRRMILTRPGERLLESARQVLRDLERAEAEVRRLGSDGGGVLRLCTQCYTCYHWLPRLLARFQRKFPKVEVRIVAEATNRAYEALLQGELDLAIVSKPVRHPGIRLQPLFQDEFVAVFAPDHPLASRRSVAPEDFRDETFLMYSDAGDNTGYQMFLAPAGVTPRRFSQVKLTEAMVEMVKARLGVAIVARWSVAPQLASGELRAARLGRSGLHRQWSAATPRALPAPPWLDEFVHLLAADPTAALGRDVHDRPAAGRRGLGRPAPRGLIRFRRRQRGEPRHVPRSASSPRRPLTGSSRGSSTTSVSSGSRCADGSPLARTAATASRTIAPHSASGREKRP
jgi:LysR family transcriptional regulator for metE and metH